MSLTVSISQLQQNLPNIIDRTIADDDVCLIERNGENVAVIVSLREWKRRTVGERLDSLGAEFRLPPDKQQRITELLEKDSLTSTEQQELENLFK